MAFVSYCRLYINTNLDKNWLFGRICTYLGGIRSGINDAETSWCSLSVINNGYHDAEKYSRNRTDFIYWKYCAELEIINNVSADRYINNINKLIEYLKSFCDGVVPSCDFEEQLR